MRVLVPVVGRGLLERHGFALWRSKKPGSIHPSPGPGGRRGHPLDRDARPLSNRVSLLVF
jgi:hypothetical protein